MTTWLYRLALEDPNHRSELELQEIRAFKEASCRMLSRKDGLVGPAYWQYRV